MNKFFKNTWLVLGTALVVFTACETETESPKLRSQMDYSLLDSGKPYADQFVDVTEQSTVDVKEGNISLQMFQSLNYYISSSVKENSKIEAQKLLDLFTNSGNPFFDIEASGLSITASTLNNSSSILRNMVASSKSQTEANLVNEKLELLFEELEEASLSINNTASQNVAGKLGSYLLDARGIETAQVIQKSLIGAFQLDYIGNTLLSSGLYADNTVLLEGKNYTQLEHNWDMAYGILTLKPIYLEGYTDAEKGTVTEFGAGAYIWEYNKANYANIYPAFLKGRAAIVNNDRVELENQASFIREEFEKAIANAALGYLGKWRTSTTDDKRAHAIGEAVGFIYSLRFATVHQVDADFSDEILLNLIGSENGFWDLDASKISTAEEAIKTKFGL